MYRISINKHTIPSLAPIVRLVLYIVLLFSHLTLSAQKVERKKILLDTAGLILSSESNRDMMRILYDVQLSHSTIKMYCDSAWVYKKSNMVDAFGRVHIINKDTLHMYADFVNYKGQTSFAQARGHVILKDPSLKLTTDTLDYDMANDIGYYNCWGTIVDSSNTLTSRIGRYYSKEDLLFFKDSVKLVNEDYTMWSDTMKYNTKTEIVYIVGPTTVVGDSSTIYSENGWFNTKSKESELLKNSSIRRGDSQLQADTIYYEDNKASGVAYSNVILNDYSNQLIIAGDYATYDDFSKNAIFSDSAVFIQYYESDSLFLHADTLHIMPDTSALDQRIIMNYNHVRFFRKDMQGACDSLVYYTKDSTIRLYTDPILWADNNQMTADFIELINNSTPPSEVYLTKNSFIIQQVDSIHFNQIKGKNMIGYINGNQLYLVDVNGNGQSIFYPEDDKGVIGLNKAESSKIKIYMDNNKIRRITYVDMPVGVMNPLNEQTMSDSRLEGFVWRKSERPINRYDIYRIDGQPIIGTEVTPNTESKREPIELETKSIHPISIDKTEKQIE